MLPPEGLFIPLILAGILCVALWIWSYRIVRRARRIQSAGTHSAGEKEILHRTLSVLLGSEYLLAAIFSAAAGLVPFLGPMAILPLAALAILAVGALSL